MYYLQEDNTPQFEFVKMGLSLTFFEVSEMYVSKCEKKLVDKLQIKGPWKDAMRSISNSAETKPRLELCRGLD